MIYYVEDDDNIRELVVYTLTQSGYAARGFASAAAFWSGFDAQTPKLILLDVMLPGEDGLSLLGKLRGNPQSAHIPVMMITAKGAEYDKVIGLDAGADDYLAKPFGMMELVARVKALLRRAAPPAESPAALSAGILTLCPARRIVTVAGQTVDLTYKEFELLRCLLQNRGIAMSRESLLSHVWGYDYDGGSRTVDVHIQTLRQKLGEAGGMIHTLRGVGYRLEA